VLSENAGPLNDAIGNIGTFAEALARNSSRLDGIVAGLERMTGGTTPQRKVIYDLVAADGFETPRRPLPTGLTLAEPTATTRLQTQRFLFASGEEPEDFANAQWSDSLPALIQSKLLQSFENYDIAHAPLRADLGNEGSLRLVVDLRRFEINSAGQPEVSIAVSAKLVGSGSHLQAARVFEKSAPLEGITPAKAAAAFNRAFDALAHELVAWTASTT